MLNSSLLSAITLAAYDLVNIYVGAAALFVTLLGFVYLLAFGQVPLRQAFPFGISHLFSRRRRWREVASLQNRATAVSFDPTGRQVAAGGFDSALHVVECASQKTQRFRIHKGVVREILFGRNGVTTYSCSDDGYVLALKIVDQLVSVVAKHTSPIYALLPNADETRMYTGDRDGKLRSWDLTGIAWHDVQAEPYPHVPFPLQETRCTNAAIFALTFADDERTLFSAGGGGQLMQIDVQTFNCTKIHDFGVTVFSLALDSIHNTLYAGCADGMLRSLDLATLSVGEFRGHSDAVRWVLFKPPDRIISSSKDKTIRLWTRNSQAHTVFTGHRDYVYQLSLSSDGAKLASACGDGKVYIWDLLK